MDLIDVELSKGDDTMRTLVEAAHRAGTAPCRSKKERHYASPFLSSFIAASRPWTVSGNIGNCSLII